MKKIYLLLKLLPKLSNLLVCERSERERLHQISWLSSRMMMRFLCPIIATWKKRGLLKGVHLGVL
jgi:hypothetical protein